MIFMPIGPYPSRFTAGAGALLGKISSLSDPDSSLTMPPVACLLRKCLPYLAEACNQQQGKAEGLRFRRIHHRASARQREELMGAQL
jgi:hypothetical protein